MDGEGLAALVERRPAEARAALARQAGGASLCRLHDPAGKAAGGRAAALPDARDVVRRAGDPVAGLVALHEEWSGRLAADRARGAGVQWTADGAGGVAGLTGLLGGLGPGRGDERPLYARLPTLGA